VRFVPRISPRGTYLIARRIRILFDVWDGTTLEGQQRAVGREKLSGAPLGAASEYDRLDLDAEREGESSSSRSMRTSDSQVLSSTPGSASSVAATPTRKDRTGAGELDAGLFFIAFQRSPARQFVAIQRRLAASDALNRHTLHTSSAIFACPSGASPGEFVGQSLFSS
jgi:deferrochelatase/peroxidase EfeB